MLTVIDEIIIIICLIVIVGDTLSGCFTIHTEDDGDVKTLGVMGLLGANNYNNKYYIEGKLFHCLLTELLLCCYVIMLL
jgi:hypothetical protein